MKMIRNKKNGLIVFVNDQYIDKTNKMEDVLFNIKEVKFVEYSFKLNEGAMEINNSEEKFGFYGYLVESNKFVPPCPSLKALIINQDENIKIIESKNIDLKIDVIFNNNTFCFNGSGVYIIDKNINSQLITLDKIKKEIKKNVKKIINENKKSLNNIYSRGFKNNPFNYIFKFFRKIFAF